MDDIRSVRMGTDARDAFLGRGGTGVISFETPAGDPPYARPVSYGYDAESGEFYFRFAVGPEDAGMAAVIDDNTAVSFVTYVQTERGWRSVIATGSIEEVTNAALDPAVAAAIERVAIPFVDVYDSHPLTLEFRFFRLSPDEVTGQREAGTED